MSRDYNIALEAVNLFQKAESINLLKMSNKVSEIEQKIEDLKQIRTLLTKISNRTEECRDRADFNGDPEMMELIDRVGEICGLEKGVYAWKNTEKVKEIDNLINVLNLHVRTLENGMTQATTELTQFQHENNDEVQIVTTMVKDYKDFIRNINQKISQTR